MKRADGIIFSTLQTPGNYIKIVTWYILLGNCLYKTWNDPAQASTRGLLKSFIGIFVYVESFTEGARLSLINKDISTSLWFVYILHVVKTLNT